MSKKTQDDKEPTAPVDAEPEADTPGAQASGDMEPAETHDAPQDVGELEPTQSDVAQALDEEPHDAPPKRRRALAWGIVVVVLAFLLGGGAVGYWGWQQMSGLSQGFAGDLDGLEARLAKAEAANAATRKALADALAKQADPQALAALAAQVAALKNSVSGFQSSVDDLAIASRTSSKELIVAESKLLLSMANDRLRFERNVAAATQGLAAAKNQLSSLQSAAFAPVLEQIDTELAALETVPRSEIGDIAKELGALAKQVGGLPLTQPDLSPDPQPTARDDDTGWRALLDSVSSNLSQFVQVRRADGSDMPAVIPAEEDIVRQTLQLVLQNARLAAVRRDVENYQLSLQQALDMLAQYFESGDDGVADATKRVKTLLAKQIDPELPDVSGSLEMLNSLTASGAVTRALSASDRTSPQGSTVDSAETPVEMDAASEDTEDTNGEQSAAGGSTAGADGAAQEPAAKGDTTP